MTYTFETMEQMAAYFAEKARGIRSRVPNASPTSKRIMQAEAHAYEQCADIVANAKISQPA